MRELPVWQIPNAIAWISAFSDGNKIFANYKDLSLSNPHGVYPESEKSYVFFFNTDTSNVSVQYENTCSTDHMILSNKDLKSLGCGVEYNERQYSLNCGLIPALTTIMFAAFVKSGEVGSVDGVDIVDSKVVNVEELPSWTAGKFCGNILYPAFEFAFTYKRNANKIE